MSIPAREAEQKGLRMLKEFRDFAMKGNVVDLAVAVIIGAAFGAIVNSLVGDIVMPVVGAATHGIDFSNYFTGAGLDSMKRLVCSGISLSCSLSAVARSPLCQAR